MAHLRRIANLDRVISALQIAFYAATCSVLCEIVQHSLEPTVPDWVQHTSDILFVATMALGAAVFVLRREEHARHNLLAELDQRIRAEQQLRLLTTTLEAAANAVVITDAGGKILWVNPAFTQLTGYAAEEAIGGNPRLLKSNRHDRQFYAQLWTTITSGAVWRGELTNRRKDGSFYVEEMTITPVRAAAGEITNFIAIKIDVSRRRQTEDALAASEKMLRSLFNDSPYGMLRVTEDGRMLSVNPALCQMLGYDSEAELMAVNLADVYLRAEDRQRLLEQERAIGTLWGIEVAWKTRLGAPITVSLTCHSRPDSGGERTFGVFVQDITRAKGDEAELRRLNRVLSALTECNRAVVHAGNELELLQQVASIIVEIGGYRMAWVGYAEDSDAKAIRPMAKAGFCEDYLEGLPIAWSDTEHGRGPSGTAVRTGEPCICNHALQDPKFAAWRERAQRHGFASVLALPLRQDSKSIGVLTIYSENAEAFDSAEANFLRQMSEDLAFGILSLRAEAERALAAEALRQAEEKYRAIFQGALIGIFQSHDGTRPTSVNATMARMHGYDSPEHFAAEVGNAKRLFVDPEQFERIAQALRDGTNVSGIEAEIYRRDGSKFWAAISVHAVRGHDGKVVCSEGTVEDISDRKAAEAKVLFLALYDPLTGLPNRRLLQDRLSGALATARRRHDQVGLLFLDLDRFKIINDSLGHSFGDRLLQQVARRLQLSCREEDTVARVGGDEFLVVVPAVHEAAEVAGLATRILEAFNQEFVISGRQLNVACSIGISIYPDHGRDTETLIKNADAAMYAAKENGRGTFRFFTQVMNTEVVEKLTFENDLRRALQEDKLFLAYQPQVDVATGQIAGVEALLRWQHPQLGLVATEKVIQAAEVSGLILPIGEWVLRTACAQARHWQDQGLGAVPVAVNVSAIQFYDGDFPGLVRKVLSETELAPERLELELTETVLTSDPKRMFAVLESLRSVGVRLAIDDFGAGYSSFSYLRKFRADKLKIDQSFVKDVAINAQAAAITSSIISMARSLRVRVTAEGVEDEAQMTFLREQACDEVQGYYFSRPLKVEEITKQLAGKRVAHHGGNAGALAATPSLHELPIV